MRATLRMALAVCLATAMVCAGPPSSADRPEACAAASPATPAAPATCTYGPATIKGGIDALGSWVVTIRRGASAIVIDSSALPQTCTSTGPRTICPIGTILPGDMVSSVARAAPAFVGTGNPCPLANPGAPPPIAGGEC